MRGLDKIGHYATVITRFLLSLGAVLAFGNGALFDRYDDKSRTRRSARPRA
ncbi:MAG TPA: hypothetical protein VKM94_25745 [Blastocatellia bacterium]|nr:hypothetical protein [Blastocatellia bacterium]